MKAQSAFQDLDNDTTRKNDRILVLETIPGEKPVDSKGKTNSSLFSTEVPLHAVMDDRTLMWSFKYENGSIPPALRGEFTSFRKALQLAEWYFKKRNVRIKEIKD